MSRNFKEGRYTGCFKGKHCRTPPNARHERFMVGRIMIWYPWRGVPYATAFGKQY